MLTPSNGLSGFGRCLRPALLALAYGAVYPAVVAAAGLALTEPARDALFGLRHLAVFVICALSALALLLPLLAVYVRPAQRIGAGVACVLVAIVGTALQQWPIDWLTGLSLVPLPMVLLTWVLMVLTLDVRSLPAARATREPLAQAIVPSLVPARRQT